MPIGAANQVETGAIEFQGANLKPPPPQRRQAQERGHRAGLQHRFGAIGGIVRYFELGEDETWPGEEAAVRFERR